MKQTLRSLFAIAFSVTALVACGVAPRTFQKSADGGDWSSIMLRNDLSYEDAFGEIVDVIARKYELDMISKDGGYLRTNWIYTWDNRGGYIDNYRTRVIIKFTADRTRVDVKTEAEYRASGEWVRGFDTALLTQTKQDIMGVVGRTVL